MVLQMNLPETMYGRPARHCGDEDVHDPHSKYRHDTGTTTWCWGTDEDEAAEFARAREDDA